MTFSFLAIRALRSSERPPSKTRPYSRPLRARSNSSAEVLRTLEGMQPQFKHVPPTRSLSMRVTSAPSWAALIAATYPPGPAPMTTTLDAMNRSSRSPYPSLLIKGLRRNVISRRQPRNLDSGCSGILGFLPSVEMTEKHAPENATPPLERGREGV